MFKKQPRLSQWNGRRRSSPENERESPRRRRRALVVRLVFVWLTTAAVTLLAAWWGPPLPYRVGEIYPYDLRARVDFDLSSHVELVHLKQTPEGPELSGERARRSEPVQEQAQHTERTVVERYPQGVVLVPRGEPIQERQLVLLQAEHVAFVRTLDEYDHLQRGAGLFLIFSLLTSTVALYVARFQILLARSLPTILGICLLVLVTLTLGLFLSQAPWHAVFVPLTLTAMVLTIAYNPQFALLLSFSMALAMAVMLGANTRQLLVQMGGLSAAVLLLRDIRTRSQLVHVGLGAGLAYLLMTVATGLLSGQTWGLIAADSFRHFLWGTLAGFLLSGLLPLVERTFGIITDISLLELADGSHPLLQELVRRAPGTYTHSMTVATLAEAAAEAIGAHRLLTRVGAYFHDIGKMLKPQYFIENQNGENRHDVLEPALSTLVIIGHVKDGLALGRQHHLPRPILDFIAQHHGTTLVEYFYREAMRQREHDGGNNGDLEASFRYAGPKPHNRENGILMLADAVESSSRSLHSPTPGSLQKLVHDLLMKRLLDGQFEESGLTLTELHLIEESLAKSLIALFHARIRYPEALPQEKAS